MTYPYMCIDIEHDNIMLVPYSIVLWMIPSRGNFLFFVNVVDNYASQLRCYLKRVHQSTLVNYQGKKKGYINSLACIERVF
jgi:hypothetical protein